MSDEPMARRAGASNGLYRPLVTMLARGAESIVVRYGDHARAQVVCHGIRKGLKGSGVSGVSVDCRGRAVIIRREEP